MSITALIRFLRKFPLKMILRMDRTLNGFYRACFLSSLLSQQPLCDRLAHGHVVLEDLAAQIETDAHEAGLAAWLDFGVSLGVLARNRHGYRLKSRLARQLAGQDMTPWRAYLRFRVEGLYGHVLFTPDMLRNADKFQLQESLGELYAQTSRTVEPVLVDLVRKTTPRQGPCRLLEVGCGSGVYIRTACQANPELTALGLEIQESTANFARQNLDAWGLAQRASIMVQDVRQHRSLHSYDIISLHNLIYYFPRANRGPLFDHLSSLLKPGALLIITSLCQGPLPSIRVMDLWSSMNRDCGPLPTPQELKTLLEEHGFTRLSLSEIIPGFWSALARNPE